MDVRRRAFAKAVIGTSLLLSAVKGAGAVLGGRASVSLPTHATLVLQFALGSAYGRREGYRDYPLAELGRFSRLGADERRHYRLTRSFHALSTEALDSLANAGGYSPEKIFFPYYRLVLPIHDWGDLTRVEAVASEIRARPDVTSVGVFLPGGLPGVVAGDSGLDPASVSAFGTIVPDPCTDAYTLGTLESTLVSHGIWPAWEKYRLDGEGVRIVDFERDWGTHPDLPRISDPAAFLATGVRDGALLSRQHGTRVAGLMAALRNQSGVNGIAPRAEYFFAPVQTKNPNTGALADDLPNALSVALLKDKGGSQAALERGSIALLETQPERWTTQLSDDPLGVNFYTPAESMPDTWAAIKAATGAGVVVVECAGNYEGFENSVSRNLNRHAEFASGGRQLDVSGPGFEDSGGIVVSAANPRRNGSAAECEILPTSNYGNRVDCAAWGAMYLPKDAPDVVNCPPSTPTGVVSLVSTDVASTGPDLARSVGGTSAAGALIAGMAALIQQHAKRVRQNGDPLSPNELRALLKRGDAGHPAIYADGVVNVPDLVKLLPLVG